VTRECDTDTPEVLGTDGGRAEVVVTPHGCPA
jgi:hypothetical protein